MRMPFRRPAVAALAVTFTLGAAAAAAGAPDPQGLRGEYFDAQDLSGTPVATRIDPTVDFDWGANEPVPGVGEAFSVRWTGTVTAPATDRYTFVTRSDDGVRLWVDGNLVIDDWKMHSAAERSGQVDLVAGRAVDLKLEYFDGRHLAVAKLQWTRSDDDDNDPDVIPADRLAPPRTAVPATEPVKPADDPILPVTLSTTAAGPSVGTAGSPVATLPGAAAVSAEAPAPVLPPPAPPVAGESFNAEPESGEVLVRRPEDGALIPLETGASLPVGTRLDARNGEVQLQTAPAQGVSTRTQQATFSGATFKVGQPRKGGKVVTIDMQHGDFESCAGPASARAKARRAGKAPTARSAARRSSRRVRAIFGSGKGRFRTKGRHAAATVRGTVWSVEDRCDATVTRVREGVVDVEDLSTGKTVAVEAGESYTARPKSGR